jgi:putative membrane protein
MDTQIRDQLARQRTELANERTLLAYIRTALGFVIVGVPAMWWLEHPYIQVLGWLSLAAGAVCLALGIGRFMAIRSMIAREFDLRDGSTPTERRGAA